MTFSRLAALAAVALAALVAVPPGPAAAEPLTSADVVALAESDAGEDLIRALVDQRGFIGPTGVGQVVALKNAGLSDALLMDLIALAPASEDGPAMEVREGVLVISGRGTAEDAAPEADGPPAGGTDGMDAAHHAHAAATPVVVSVSAPASPQAAFPAAATFGASGGAVFVPSHFGASPSAFGKVVIVGPSFPVVWPVGVGVPVGVPVASPVAPPSRYDRIPIRTSRGTIYLPN